MATCRRPIYGGKVVVELTYFWPERRRRDTHDRIKDLMDVLEKAGVFANDCPSSPTNATSSSTPADRGRDRSLPGG